MATAETGPSGLRTIAIINQKGGCGKTTTAVNLGGALAQLGRKVLVVDVDPQAHATLALGVDPEEIDANLYEVLIDTEGAAELPGIIRPVSDGLDLAPSGIVMTALEQRLTLDRAEDRSLRLGAALATIARRYDIALIDCAPNVGLLAINALRAAQEVIVPVELSFFALHGVEKLLDTVSLLAERAEHSLRVRLLATLFDGRTRYAREALATLRKRFGALCFDTVIRQNVRLRQAAEKGQPIVTWSPRSNGALDYNALAVEVTADEISEDLFTDTFLAEPPPREPERTVEVHYRDERASDVRIAGDFNGWVPDKDVTSRVHSEAGERVWTKVLTLAPGTYQYRYVVDGEWREDPENPRGIPGRVGGRISLLVVS